MIQSIQVARGKFVMVGAILYYDYDEEKDTTFIYLRGRKSEPFRVPGDYAKRINAFLARGSVTLYLDGTCQDRK